MSPDATIAASLQRQVDAFYRDRETSTGQTLERILRAVPPPDRPILLAHLEQINRKEGNFELLREVKAYKAMSRQPLRPSTPPLKSA